MVLTAPSSFIFLCSFLPSDYIIEEKAAVLQKREHEGFGFVLRGAKGKGQLLAAGQRSRGAAGKGHGPRLRSPCLTMAAHRWVTSGHGQARYGQGCVFRGETMTLNGACLEPCACCSRRHFAQVRQADFPAGTLHVSRWTCPSGTGPAATCKWGTLFTAVPPSPIRISNC